MNQAMESAKRRRLRTAAVFAALVAVMVALQWNWFAMPLERDEGEYAYAAWLMRTGKGVPYRDSFLQKPPMVVYTYGLVETVAPGSDKVGFRVAGFLAALATAGLVWGIGRRESGGRAGMWAAWLWVAFLHQLFFYPVAANVEKFMVVPMLGAMAAAGPGERRAWRWGLAGVLAGMAVLYKPICVPVLGVYFPWALFAGGRTGASPRPPGSVWQMLGWLATGGMLAAGAGMAWFAWKGALGAMWECAVEYTGEYAKLTGHPLQTGVWFLASADHWKAWATLGLAVAGFAWGGRRGWGWGAVAAVAWGTAMADANGHYYLMALPLAALGAGAGVEKLAGRFGHWGGWAGAAGVMAVFAVMLSGNEGLALRATPRQLASRLYKRNPFVEAEEAGRLVAQLCPEDGTVHMVGSEPEILWYARRKGATRFDIAYPMTLPTRRAPGYQAEAMDALEGKTPNVIVIVLSRLGFLGPVEGYAEYLQAMEEMVLGGKYRLEWSCVPDGGGWVAGGEWAERALEGASMGIWKSAGGK